MDVMELIRQGKIKRYFRSTRKLNTPNLVSHITQRAAGREPLFLEQEDYLSMLEILKEVSDVRNVSIYAFCLMPNHLHLLLSPEKDNLFDAMRDLFSRYGMRFNRKYERKGHLFGGPFRQAVCLDDSYLLAVSLYIHLNPVTARLAENPIKYRWSSCRLYCDRVDRKSFVTPGCVLGLLSKERSEQKRLYEDLLGRCLDIKTKDVFEQKYALDKFLSSLYLRCPAILKRAEEHGIVSKSMGLDLLGMDVLNRRVEALKTGRLPPPESRRARRYLIEQLIARGYTRKEIAGRLEISRKTVYNLLHSRWE